MEFGLSSFGDLNPAREQDPLIDPAVRVRNLLEEIRVADEVGIEVFGLGEHHRPDYAISAPEIVLAAAAAQTSRIRLSSAVTVLSSADPVRVYQDFATLDLVSGGRAEIWAGRGSFIESFPLFGQDLADYDELYAEKLNLLLYIREHEIVTWSGRHRPAIDGRGIYPRAVQQPLPVWLASGGTLESARRAGELGVPMILAIIGGQWRRFRSIVEIHRHAARTHGHEPDAMPVAINSLGYVARDSQTALDDYYPAYTAAMRRVARERGWGRMTREAYDAQVAPEGALYVGSPQQIIEKILRSHEVFGHDRFVLQLGTGTIPHRDMLAAIELFGTVVIPAVRSALSSGDSPQDSEVIAL
jgi:probable LLM family oxidoreductase